jgi:hypothetical protein
MLNSRLRAAFGRGFGRNLYFVAATATPVGMLSEATRVRGVKSLWSRPCIEFRIDKGNYNAKAVVVTFLYSHIHHCPNPRFRGFDEEALGIAGKATST